MDFSNTKTCSLIVYKKTGKNDTFCKSNFTVLLGSIQKNNIEMQTDKKVTIPEIKFLTFFLGQLNGACNQEMLINETCS